MPGAGFRVTSRSRPGRVEADPAVGVQFNRWTCSGNAAAGSPAGDGQPSSGAAKVDRSRADPGLP